MSPTRWRLYTGLLRPHQYVKNLFVFLPSFFGARITDADTVLKVLPVFGGFCLLASAVYILNDIADIEEDRNHPRKRHRPLASGAIGTTGAAATASVLAAAALATAAAISVLSDSWEIFWLFLLYLALNVSYSIKIKRYAIADVVVIAVGFVIRLFAGAVASGIALSMWIIVMTFLLALFLALSKRRDDVVIFLEDARKARRSVDGYNLEFLNAAMVIMASVVVVSYIMYAVSPEVTARFRTDKLYLTTIFVVVGILRYMQIAFVRQDGGSPTRVLLEDPVLRLTVAGWVASFILIIYRRPFSP